MNAASKKYFVIYSAGSKVSLVALASAASIIDNAARELRRENSAFEALAGIVPIKNAQGVVEPVAPFTVVEKLILAVKKLNEKSRTYATFPASPGGARAFIEAADRQDCGIKARSLVRRAGIDPMK